MSCDGWRTRIVIYPQKTNQFLLHSGSRSSQKKPTLLQRILSNTQLSLLNSFSDTSLSRPVCNYTSSTNRVIQSDYAESNLVIRETISWNRTRGTKVLEENNNIAAVRIPSILSTRWYTFHVH